MKWYDRNDIRWQSEQRIAKSLLDEFQSGIHEDGVAFLEGVFHVRSEHGHRYASVKIRIEYPNDFPKRGMPPIVYLISHRNIWQKGGESHINHDWSLCLYVPGESGINFYKHNSLEHLFAILQTFLFKEHVYQQALAREFITGTKAVWPGPARSHGIDGIREAVQHKGRVHRNQPCPCGSGVKFKDCCRKHMGDKA